MTPQEMYRQLDFVRRIVDAYAAVVPLGGLVLECGERTNPVEVDDVAGLVRQLVLNGRGRARVRVIGDERDIAFEHSDLVEREPSPGGRSQLEVMGGNADAYANLFPRVSDPLVARYLAMLRETFEIALGLSLWALDPGTDIRPMKTALDRFRLHCDRYRRDIQVAVTTAFQNGGCRARWSGELEGKGLAQFAPIYRGLKEGLGIDLAPLRDEAVRLTEQAVGMLLLSRQDLQQVRSEYGLPAQPGE
jgi:hypothetical protein